MKTRLATLNEFTSKIVTNNEAMKRIILSDVRPISSSLILKVLIDVF